MPRLYRNLIQIMAKSGIFSILKNHRFFADSERKRTAERLPVEILGIFKVQKSSD
jgi:hypothetical protein